MYLVVIKFIEVFTRAAFIVGTSYSLSLSGAGQFGIVATWVGLFAFAFNWERQVDIQRRYAGLPEPVFDRAVSAALPFWGFNQLIMLPIFAAVVWSMAHLTPMQLALAVVIVSCEHIANQTYQMALISPRYTPFLGLVAGKNVGVLAAILPYVILFPSKLTLDYALIVWASGQVLCAFAVFALWWQRSDPAPHEDGLTRWQRLFAQHRASFTHFQIGLIAILMLQYDRLIAGWLLPLDQTGLYLRHVLIVSFVYQFFNVASYNRIMPRIFAAARTECDAQLLAQMRPELMRMFAVVGAAFAIGVAIDAATGHAITARYHLSIAFAGILTLGALLRVMADFLGMIANARMREKVIRRQQLIAFIVGAVLLALAVARFGVGGAVGASFTISALYLFLIQRAVRAFPKVETA